MDDRNIIISTKTIVLFWAISIGAVSAMWLIYKIWPVIGYFFMALILALALEPFVEALTKRKFHRVTAVLVVVLTALASFIALFLLGIIPFANELQSLLNDFPTYVQQTVSYPPLSDYSAQLTTTIETEVSRIPSFLISATINIFSGIVTFLTILIFLIYMLIDFKNIRSRFFNLFPKNSRSEVQDSVISIEVKLGSWLRGQLLLMLIIGVITYIGLLLIGMPYATALAVLAGLFEIIPYIGPVIAAIPAVIIGFSVSPLMGVVTIIFYLLVQQLENIFIVPKVMQRAIGFNPLVTIMVLMVGVQLFGPVGVILAIPIALIVAEIITLFLKKS